MYLKTLEIVVLGEQEDHSLPWIRHILHLRLVSVMRAMNSQYYNAREVDDDGARSHGECEGEESDEGLAEEHC